MEIRLDGKVTVVTGGTAGIGRSEDIATPLLFLASDQASYFTGTCIEISGGKFCVQNPEAAWSS